MLGALSNSLPRREMQLDFDRIPTVNLLSEESTKCKSNNPPTPASNRLKNQEDQSKRHPNVT